jgi:hypothetical protein
MKKIWIKVKELSLKISNWIVKQYSKFLPK